MDAWDDLAVFVPKPRAMHKPARAALIGAAFAALITLPGLANGTLWDNSETAYGEVAREILFFHDWIVMHLNGAAWFIQPPLYFWIAAAFAKLFSVGSFAMRLPSALATIAMGAITGYAVARQVGSRAGIYATVILSTSLMQAIVGRLAIMDAMLDLAVALSVFWWFRGLQTGRDRYFVFGWIAAALGCLTKGPVALVVALLIIVPFYFWNSRVESTRLPSWRGWVFGILLFAAITLPWFVALTARTGVGAVIELLGHYTFGRYTGTIENQAGPFWYYVPVLILGFFPWIAFFPASVMYGIRRLKASGADATIEPVLRLAFCWIVVPFIFFSFAKTKLPNYIALELPGLALLVALYFESVVLSGRRRSMLISAAVVPVTIGMLAFAIWAFVHDNRLAADASSASRDLIAAGAAIFIGSLLTALLVVRRSTISVAPYMLGLASLSSVLALAIISLPRAEQFKPVPYLASVIQRMRVSGDAVAIEGVSGGNALTFYTQPTVHTLAVPSAVVHPGDTQQPARDVICGAARIFIVTSRQHADQRSFGRRRELIATRGHDALYLIDGPGCKG
ncbi:MAG: glycosyltransferase family 39 protein [Candidatus Baltobacteraceae bacterium]